MRQQMLPSIRITLVLVILTGLVYPAVVTGLARLLFPEMAHGSLVRMDGKVIGSGLIGQKFTKAVYFHGRPSAAGDGYDAASSGASNFGSTSRKLADRVNADVARFKNENPQFTGAIPADLLTTSGSGLDPHISPASARAQIARVANARGIPESKVLALVSAYTEGRQYGVLGEPRVNVLNLNLALDQLSAIALPNSP